MKVYDESGCPLDATFSADSVGRSSAELFFESMGPGRNTDYQAGLELLLRRASREAATIRAMEVASADAIRDYSLSERAIEADGYGLPIVLSRVSDFRELRARICTGQSKTAKQAETRGGNPTRRIRLALAFSSEVPADLESRLAGLANRRYWAFLGDPGRYDIEGAIRDLTTDVWATDGKPVAKGDKAILWKALGGEARRGIVALAEVVSDPELVPDSLNPYWRGDDPLAEERMRVELRYLTPPGLPLWLTDKGPKWLGELSVARARGGSVFYLTPEQWDEIISATGQESALTDDEESIESFIRGRPGGRGQGTGLDAPSRKAVELHAMERAREYYQEDWSEIFDVSANAPYDLHLRRGKDELRVEVKGTTGSGETVILTHREVEAAIAHHPATSLFVVSHIHLDRRGVLPVATGGDAIEISPWMPREEALTATTFRYEVPKQPP